MSHCRRVSEEARERMGEERGGREEAVEEKEEVRKGGRDLRHTRRTTAFKTNVWRRREL